MTYPSHSDVAMLTYCLWDGHTHMTIRSPSTTTTTTTTTRPTTLVVVSTTINAPHWHASQCNGQRCKQGREQAECPCHISGRALGKVSSHLSSLPPTSLTSFAAPGRQCKQDSKQAEHPCYINDVGAWECQRLSCCHPPPLY